MKRLWLRTAVLLLALALLLPCTGCDRTPGFTFQDGKEMAPDLWPPIESPEGEWVWLSQGFIAYGPTALPETWEGRPVLAVGHWNLTGQPLSSPEFSVQVSIPSVIAVCESAFASAARLTAVTFRDIRYIDRRAFEGCVSLTELVFPACLEVIAEGAFAGCTGLISVRFEGDPILKNCFPANPGLILYGQPGGNVEEYAQARGIAFEALSD